MTLPESMVEAAALEWFGELGYSCLGAEALTPAAAHGERVSCVQVLLVGRLREAIRRLNPTISKSRSFATLRDPAPAGLAKLRSGALSERQYAIESLRKGNHP